MRLTRFTDYSLRVLIYLGQHDDARVTINQISECYDISKNHLMKVVSNLTRSQFVAAQRGPGGGIRLNHPPAAINLGEVIAATERNLPEEVEPANTSGNEPETDIRLNNFLQHALQAYLDTLGQFTLADILEPEAEKPESVELRDKAA